MMARTLCAAMVAVLMGVSLSAQTECDTSCQVRVGQSFVAFTEADPMAATYALLVNGQDSGVPPQFVNGLVEFAHPGFSKPAEVTLAVHATADGVTFQYTDTLSLSVVRRKLKVR